jgi:competence protein ComEA
MANTFNTVPIISFSLLGAGFGGDDVASRDRGIIMRVMPPRHNWTLVLGYGLVLALLATGALLIITRPSVGAPIQLEPPPTPRPVRVHVAGAVAQPGVYALAAGSIVQDALQLAGGALADADLDQINLARLVHDGDQVWVPGLTAPGPLPPAAMPPATSRPAAGPDGLIDLNRATANELAALPRIGPALAQRIVAYRAEHGPFASVDDLLSVSGIGPAILEDIRDLVTLP